MEQNQMKQFCIDLEGVMLPDAIAAIVEAWHDAQNIGPELDWAEELRLQIKREFGRGWSVRGVGATKLNPKGKCQLTRIAPDRSRSSVIIPVEWDAFNAEQIKAYVFQLIDLHNCTNSSLQNCLSTMDALGAFANAPANVF
jgi:hypothetical protein